MARKSTQWPCRVVSGKSTVTVYRYLYKGAERFQLRWVELGENKNRAFSDEKEAILEAKDIASRLHAGESAALNLTAEQAAIYKHALSFCGDVPIDAVCREWAEAHRRLGKIPIMQAVDDWVLRNSGKSIPLNECVDLFLADQKRRGNTSEYIRIAGARLELVKTAFGGRSVVDITANDLREFIDGRGGEPKTRKNFRDIIVSLWRWSRAEGYLPRDIQTEAERVTPQKVKRKGRIEIFTPEEMGRLLEAAGPELFPVVAICGLAGVRSGSFGEIARLRWEEVRWSQGIIEVVQSKANGRRIIPMQPNLKALLQFYTNKTGLIWTGGRIDKAFERLAESCGVEWKHNALRHSFGSYRVACTKSVDQTSLEMGNSPSMVRKHYLEHVEEAEGKKWFAIMPKKKC